MNPIHSLRSFLIQIAVEATLDANPLRISNNWSFSLQSEPEDAGRPDISRELLSP